MAMWERHTQKLSPKEPSFSSSLLDAIYRSIDETRGGANDHQKPHRRNTAAQLVDHDIESLRRAIIIEKWMESHTAGASTSTPRHIPSNSGSSTDSSVFSSSETDSSASSKHKNAQTPPSSKLEAVMKKEGRFSKTKSKAQKIYGDLKKVKEPNSPGGKIANFLNSIFSPRNLKASQCVDEWSSMRKSRSMKDTATCSLASRSCLSKNASSRGSKSKRSVRFCPVSVIVDEDCQPCGHKSIYNDECMRPGVGSQFIKKNIDSFRVFEGKNVRKYEIRDCYDHDLDDVSCASSDLFELENIGRVEEELPVYETTSLQMNKMVM